MRGRHRTNFLVASVKERKFERQANNALKALDLNLFISNSLRGNPQNYWGFAPVSHTAEHAESVKILHVNGTLRESQLNDFHSFSPVENFSGIKLFHYDAQHSEAKSADDGDQHDRARADERLRQCKRACSARWL